MHPQTMIACIMWMTAVVGSQEMTEMEEAQGTTKKVVIIDPDPQRQAEIINNMTYNEMIESIIALARFEPYESFQYDVNLGLRIWIGHLFKLNEPNSMMTAKFKQSFSWWDHRVARFWPREVRNFTGHRRVIKIPYNKIWKPKVPIRNQVKPSEIISSRSVTVIPGGHLNHLQVMISHTACDIDAGDYPYDTQYCLVVYNAMDGPEFGPNAYMKAKIDKNFFVENSEWRIENINVYQTGSNAIVRITVKRNIADPLFYLAFPGCLISLVSYLQFVLPASGGERTGLGVTCMLSMVVFMTILQEKFAPDEESLPRLAIYFATITFNITMVTAMSITVICINSRRNRSHYGPPGRIWRFTCGILAKVLWLKHAADGLSKGRVLNTRNTKVMEDGHQCDKGDKDIVINLDKIRQLQGDGEQWEMVAQVLNRSFALLSFTFFTTVSFYFLLPPQ